MPEFIPPIWFSLYTQPSKVLVLYDEGTVAGLMDSLDFYGEHVYASVVENASGTAVTRGAVVVKNENPIDLDSPTPAYFTSHGSFTTPENVSNFDSYVTHVVDESYNVNLVSGTMMYPTVAGIYAMTLTIQGATTSSICIDSSPDPAYDNEHKEFYYFGAPIRFTLGASLVLNGINPITYANCHLQNTMSSDFRGLFNMNGTSNRIQCSISVQPSVVIDPPPDSVPSSAGTFTFTMQRVSLGS